MLSLVHFVITYRVLSLGVHSHLRFIRRELLAEQWTVLYETGTFTLAIWLTFAWTEKSIVGCVPIFCDYVD